MDTDPKVQAKPRKGSTRAPRVLPGAPPGAGESAPQSPHPSTFDVQRSAFHLGTSKIPLPEIPWAPTFRAALLAWFRAEGRDYPWRQTTDPYAILVSEMMLQQTQIATVLGRGYYHRWMDTFPDVATLAAASENDPVSTEATKTRIPSTKSKTHPHSEHFGESHTISSPF